MDHWHFSTKLQTMCLATKYTMLNGTRHADVTIQQYILPYDSVKYVKTMWTYLFYDY
jgi:hypothetical protein